MTPPARWAFLPILAALCLVLAVVQASPLHSPAKAVAENAALAGIAAYVSLKSVNAVLSLAEEVEIGANFGLSGNLQPLKVLEPLDDTVERVADALFWVSVLAWVLALGIGPVSSLGFLLLAAGLLVHAARSRLDRHLGTLSPPVCRAGTAFNVTGVGLAIILPLSLALGGWLAETLTLGPWNESQAVLTEVSAHARGLLQGEDAASPDAVGEPESGWFDWPWSGTDFGNLFGQVAAYRDAAAYYLDHADAVLTASLKIVAIFLLRTLVLPLAVVVVLVTLTRRLARG